VEQLVNSLKVVLGTAFCLYYKTHEMHWNVVGENFPQLHEFFGDQYSEIYESLDPLAEHIRALDAFVPMSLERILQLSEIPSETKNSSSSEMVEILLRDNETLIRVLNDAAGIAAKNNKQGLLNFLAARIEIHEKYRWQLRATSR
jgi:starvation-inducible DNA-binding protein